MKVQAGEAMETISIFARNTPIDADETTLEKLEEILGPDNVRISG